MGENKSKKFPDYYPECCPPIKSINGDLTVYRIIESNTIKPREFISIGEKKKKYFSPTCNNFGISLLTDPADLHIAKNFFASISMEKKNKVAVGNITQDSGLYAYEPSNNVGKSHINWWTYLDVEPHTYFKEVLRIGVDI
ncbi:hypothetical protein DRW41_05430 [Neobacillus piezotolerans]|uniref:Uncharacterized protein n=1 Tax=Neobacillus piezotolerans TaxID=2259171 RepID=A0A3D8GS61_9BACI|nr:hypothetical protein [Neobacillus piezotolerans]RDU37295.1 hypothetical protein DRW41_05430 [Neobacillus piezotolerans]